MPPKGAPDAYGHCGKREDGYTKVILKPQMKG